MLNRRHLVASLALASFAGSTVKVAAAAEWPQRSVRIFYPYAAGSTGDATARLIAARFSNSFGQPFVVENHAGANGVIATEAVARSPADGYTLLFAATPQIAVAPAMMKVSYDAVKDFVPISAISSNRFALVVNAKVPVKTVAEFIDYVRTQSTGFAYADGGTGSLSHLNMVLLLDRAGLSATHVSYKGNGLTDVVAGHLPAMFALLGDALPQEKNGSIRILAVSSEQRSSLVPSVPTIAESGFPGFNVTSWWGLMAPAHTPQPIVNRIAAEVADATRDPKIVAQLTNFGVDPLGNSSSEFEAMIASDIKLWAEAIKLAGLQVN